MKPTHHLKLSPSSLTSRPGAIFLAIGLATAAVFVFDLFTPLGVADTFWYFIPLMLSSLAGGRRFSYWLAGLFSVLALAGFYFSPPGIDSHLALLNRLMFLAVIWVVAGLITRRKTADQALRRTERALRTLSDCNQALVRATEEASLLHEICRVIVEQGRYRMAWVGFAENDAKKSVTIAARAGHDDGYLAQANVNWDETSERGRGPTGTAIRTGRIVVSQDFRTDPVVAPWRAQALKRGYAASIVLPLRNGEKVLGVLTIYAAEVGAFQPAEVDLLQELAGDLAFGIQTLRARLEKKLAEATMRESEERYRALFDRSLDCVFLADFAGNFLDANPAALDLLGYQRADIPTLNFAALLTEDQLPLALQTTAEIKATGHQQHPVEYRLRGKDGREVQVETQSSLIYREGKPYAIQGIARDLTERKRAETALHRSHEQYRAAITAANAIPYLKDYVADVYVFMGEGIKALTGYTPAELRSTVWKEIILETVFLGEAAGLTVAEARRRILAGEIKSWQTDLRIRSRSGEIRWLSDSSIPQWDAGGKYVGSLGIIQDITERKQVETALRESEQRYRQLFEQESDAVLLVDCETHRFVDANLAALRLYGYRREELLLMKPEDVSEEPDKTRAIVGSGSFHVPSRWHRKKDGSRFQVEITANSIDYRGRRTELATVRDITARQQVMDELQETAAQLLEAQRIAGLGSYVFDVPSGQWTSSEVLDQVFGLADPGFKRDVAGWLHIVHPEDRAEMRRYLQEDVLQGRIHFDRNYRIVRVNDQAERWVHGLGKLILDDHGRVLRIVGVIQDITDLKRAEERAHLQFSALSAAANGIVITDRTGKIEWVNPSFTRLTGYSAAEAIGSNPRVLKSGQHPPAFYANLWATILAGNVWHGELVNKCKDGRLYTEELTITPVRGADGQITHFVAIKQDVSERRQLENRLQQAQKMEAIGTLAGGIAHDFNNILAAMFGYAFLIQQDTVGNELAQESIAEILKAAERAKGLVQQILTFSRQREQKTQVVQLNLVVKETIKFLRASLPAQIQIELNLDVETPAVVADPTQIYQVAINLATNALHAMEGSPGRLTVSLERVRPDAELIAAHPELKPMEYARLTVADTGHGMDDRTLGRIFEPFFTTKPVGKGTGLGLAVVHGIVESHDGVILVESTVGQGTTFRLYFPAQAHTSTVLETALKTAPGGGGQRILLLDDEAALTRVLERHLSRLNYRVTTSNRAREALGWCREDPRQFDLVITDLTMPEMNGLEVARQIRALRADLPVILLSGFAPELNPENLAVAGICELLQKPLLLTALADAVQRTLAGTG